VELNIGIVGFYLWLPSILEFIMPEMDGNAVHRPLTLSLFDFAQFRSLFFLVVELHLQLTPPYDRIYIVDF